MPDSLNEFGAMLAAFLPNLLAAILILVVGWLVAFLISKAVESLLRRTNIDNRLSGMLEGGQPNQIPVERWIALGVFWLIMLFVIVIFLQTLNLGGVSDPLNNLLTQVLAFLPKLLAAAVLILLAFVIATVLRLVITRVFSASVFSRQVTDSAQMDSRSRVTIGQTIGNVVYWLVFLLFLPAILDALDLGGILAPVSGMVDSILGALPNILGAMILIAVAYLIARLVGTLISSILSGLGFDRLFSPGGPVPVTGVGAATYPAEGGTAVSRTTPSQIVGWVVVVSILLFAAMEAANILGFETLTVLIGQFIVAAWNILVGLVIFGIGLWLSNQVYNMVRNTGTTNAHILASAARAAILVFAGALALRQMGIAESIVNLAFGLMLGAVAVAAAIAFGIGGRNVAADLLERWRGRLREEAAKPAPPPPSQTGPSIPRTGGVSSTPPGSASPPPYRDPGMTPGEMPPRDSTPGDFPTPSRRDFPEDEGREI